MRRRLWRWTDPSLSSEARAKLVQALMAALRAVRSALASADPKALTTARRAEDEARIGLGEGGPVWWCDGAPDLNRRMAGATPYAPWFERLDERET